MFDHEHSPGRPEGIEPYSQAEVASDAGELRALSAGPHITPAEEAGATDYQLYPANGDAQHDAMPAAAEEAPQEATGGAGSDRPPGPPKEPGVSSAESPEGPELANARHVVRQSSEQIIAALPDKGGMVQGYALSHVAAAIAFTEGPDAAHAFVAPLIERLGMRPSDAGVVWTALYGAGDQSALPHARRAAGLAGEDVSFTERLGGVGATGRSARAVVNLVEAGDHESIPLAKGLIPSMSIVDRAEQYSRLYRQGDKDSFDLALAAARQAKEHCEQTGDTNYSRSDLALSQIGHAALRLGRLDEAREIAGVLEGDSYRIALHAELFWSGDTDALQPVLDYIEASSGRRTAAVWERMLAEAGHEPSIANVRQRVSETAELLDSSTTSPIPNYGLRVGGQLEDLVTLHRIGDTSAAAKVAELVRQSNTPEYYLHHLSAVGLGEEEGAQAAELFRNNPSPQHALSLLEARHDPDAYNVAFDHFLNDQANPWHAASLLRRYAARASGGRPDAASV